MPISDQMLLRLSLSKLEGGEAVWMAFGGRSMWPTLGARDTVRVHPLQGMPQVGDVCLFELGEQLVVHRVVRIDGDNVIFQGDNNLSAECVSRAAVRGRVEAVRRSSGRELSVAEAGWRWLSAVAVGRRRVRTFAARWLSRRGRQQLRPWYFLLVAILMWTPLNGLGVPLNNYILGLRADHFLHASIYVPCTLFLIDLFPRRRSLTWIVGMAIGVLTESVQYLLPYRGFDINDMVANILGTTLGFMTLTFALAARRKKNLHG